MLAFVPQILVANPKFDKKSETVGENFSLNVSAENIVMSGFQWLQGSWWPLGWNR